MEKSLTFRYDIPSDKSGIWIRVYGPERQFPSYPDHGTLTESEADAIMQWTMENKIGVRMSYDMWRFRSAAERTAFILKWC